MDVNYTQEDLSVLSAFLEEIDDHLEEMESSTLQLEDSEDMGLVDNIFRSMHTIKGTAGFLKLPHIAQLSHNAEFLLSDVRNGKISISTEIINAILEGLDFLKNMFTDLKQAVEDLDTSKEEISFVLEDFDYEDLVGVMEGLRASGSDSDEGEKKEEIKPPEMSRKDAFGLFDVANKVMETIGAEMKKYSEESSHPVIRTGMEQIRVVAEPTKYDGLLEQLTEVINLLDFVEMTDEFLKEPVMDDVKAAFKLITKLIQPSFILNDPSIKARSDSREPAAAKKKTARASDAPEELASIRVASDRLDLLMNLVGELVASKGIFETLSDDLKAQNLIDVANQIKDAGEGLGGIVDELSTAVMQVRMIPVKTVFSRFSRMVRDLSGKANKAIKLITEGDETQLDKNVIEKLGDPLVHCIRNSADHGIEMPDDREAAGKPRQGTITLQASNEGQHVLIQIIDDGKGIPRDVVGKKAIEKGIITQEQFTEMTDTEVYQLVMAAGFSTAAKITEISGRGVGMDVVRSNIEKIGGRVTIDSELGKGTTIALLIPLTLTIIRGLEIEAEGEHYILPLESVVETVELSEENKDMAGDDSMYYHRGEYLPVLKLSELFELDPVEHQSPLTHIVVMKTHGNMVALQIDQPHREIEIVLKPFSKVIKTAGISGAAIQSDGNVILVLNPEELSQMKSS